MNFYGVLIVVCVLGVASIAFARYEYRHPASATSTPPTVGTTWFAALGIDACGTMQGALAPNPASPGGFHAIANGAIQVSPSTASQAGDNATLDKFVNAYAGLQINAARLTVPAPHGHPSARTTWRTGQPCPSGTKYAGKAGRTVIAFWPSVSAKRPAVALSTSQVKFTPNMLITFFYGPSGVTPPKPPQSAIDAMLNGPTTTTTTTKPVVTPTTAPTSSTTTTSSASTTTTTTAKH